MNLYRFAYELVLMMMIMKVCVDCGVHWHDSMSCEEFQILPVDERYPDDITLHRLARCGHEFCYCYGAEYRQGQHSCTCDTFNSEQETVSASSDPTVLSGCFLALKGLFLSELELSVYGICLRFTGNIRIGSREALYWWDFKDA
ncbi:hypothetical protein F2Q69_00032488 [Brassica cretica]|uniref:IBR domain-containing protein n=1 Tax=Brassica cretica TaxID=69181 RepID=A0A8S9S8M1_BRACR|nr:hypothetical protein F2Q69_00032488 [Brassica cretica]